MALVPLCAFLLSLLSRENKMSICTNKHRYLITCLKCPNNSLIEVCRTKAVFPYSSPKMHPSCFCAQCQSCAHISLHTGRVRMGNEPVLGSADSLNMGTLCCPRLHWPVLSRMRATRALSHGRDGAKGSPPTNDVFNGLKPFFH